MRSWLSALADLVLPAACAGCGAAGAGTLCGDCRRVLAAARPRMTRPCPCPPGLPATAALAAYAGALRSALLAYKERGRHTVATVLGERLAEVVISGLGVAGPAGVLIIPVPATAEAIRRRRGDHMVRLARVTVAALRRRGVPARCAMPLRALPRQDSAGLTAQQRLAVAGTAFQARARQVAQARTAVAAGAVVVLVDDIVTTGATLAAAATTLRRCGLPVVDAAVLAATQRGARSRKVISSGG